MDKEEIKKFVRNRLESCAPNTLRDASWYYTDVKTDESDDYAYDLLKSESGASWVEHGCSKVVLGFNELINDSGKGYVVKIPFLGERGFSTEDESLNTEYIYENAGSENVHVSDEWDYCEAEAQIYQHAVEWGIEKVFAETSFLCFVYDIPVYISECVLYDNISWDTFDKASVQNKVDSTNFSRYSHYVISKNIFSILLSQYGEDFCCDLVDFINYYDINDIHDENVGTMKDDTFKIFDYSDFRS